MAYYPEMLAQLGWPDDPAVMVGDDIEREVKPTQAAGLPVFWVRKPGEFSAELAGVPQGPLRILPGLARKDRSGCSSKSRLRAPRRSWLLLRSSPAALATLISSLPQEAWTQAACTGRMVPDRDHLPPARCGT